MIVNNNVLYTENLLKHYICLKHSHHIHRRYKVMDVLINLTVVIISQTIHISNHHTVHYQFGSVSQLCLTLCNPMNHSTPGLPVHHQLLEITQTHAHRVSDAIQPCHPLSSLSPPAPNPSQHYKCIQFCKLHLEKKILLY